MKKENINYSDFSKLDFITDDAFIRWVIKPDKDSNIFWSNWIKDHPDKQDVVDQAKKLLCSINIEDIEWEEGSKQSLKIKILKKIKYNNSNNKRILRLKNKKLPFYIGAAAVMTGVIFMVSFLIWKPALKGQVSYHTAYGEIREITLPDHSTITLGANSDLSYKVDQQHRYRETTLKGKAYFNVSKDESKPFIVHINDVVVKVLGTQFNIDQTGDTTTILLQSGKVRLLLPDTLKKAGTKNTLDMQPGELVSYSVTSHSITHKKVTDTDLYTAWKDHLLIFDKTTLQQITKKIYHIYGIYLKFPPDMVNQTFSAEVHIEDKYPGTLLKLLSESFQLEMKRVKDTIYATSRIQ